MENSENRWKSCVFWSETRMGQPFQPFQQLMSVLPPVSAEEAGIPAAMRELMKQSFSPHLGHILWPYNLYTIMLIAYNSLL